MRAKGKRLPPTIARLVAVAASLLSAPPAVGRSHRLRAFRPSLLRGGARPRHFPPTPSATPWRSIRSAPTTTCTRRCSPPRLSGPAATRRHRPRRPPSSAVSTPSMPASPPPSTGPGTMAVSVDITIDGRDPDSVAPDSTLPQTGEGRDARDAGAALPLRQGGDHRRTAAWAGRRRLRKVDAGRDRACRQRAGAVRRRDRVGEAVDRRLATARPSAGQHRQA